MNRYNFGNQITNGMQILSIAGTTASSFQQQSKRAHLADASSALNNLSEEQLQQVGQMKAGKLMDEVTRYNAKGESPFQHLSPEEAGAYQMKKAEDMRKYAYGEDEENVDELMSGTAFSEMSSPQADALSTYIQNNFDYSNRYARDKATGRIRRMTKEDIIESLKVKEEE